MSEAFARRLRAFVIRVGQRRALERLHVGGDTLDAAREAGFLTVEALERLTVALEREELALLAVREAS